MSIDTMNTPTPDFRSQLESEIARAYRREERLGAPREPRRGRLRGLSLLAACLAVGAVSGIVSAQARDFARRDSLLESARAELAITALRLDLARAQMENAAQKMKIGAVDADGLASAEAELRSMETRAMRAKLNIDEIGAGSQPPRDDLNAPLVGGRDFVTERIRLDLVNAQQQLSVAERTLATVERRVRAGAESELARAEAQLEVARASASLATLAERMSLRRAFLENESAMPAAELAKRVESATLRQDIRVAQQALELAKARVENVQQKRAVGVATELDVMRAQVELKERELELYQLTIQLRRVGGEREPPS